VLIETALKTTIRCNLPSERKPFYAEFGRQLPDVPVQMKTILLMDLMVQQRAVDLRQMTQLILSDLGATLQILRLAGREYDTAESRPSRIEDCISDLGLDACLRAVAAQVAPFDGRRDAIAALWHHSREIAEYSRLVAEESSDADPGQAYLAGLLHAIGSLPRALGWSWKRFGSDSQPDGLELATRWSLPICVVELFSDGDPVGQSIGWAEIVRRAHRYADSSCSPEERLFAPLQRVK